MESDTIARKHLAVDFSRRHSVASKARRATLLARPVRTERRAVDAPGPTLMLLLLRNSATPDQIAQMLANWEVLIKVVVDTRREILTGGGEMHADGEALLLADGSQQEDLWGANWYPASREIRFEALINIRPRQNNRRMQVENEAVRRKMEAIVRRILEG